MTLGFNTDTYLEEQIKAFSQRMNDSNGDAFLEFGGKPFGDFHASRVLPGYDPDCKAKILKEVTDDTGAKVVMVINTLDIIPAPEGRTPNGRIRGDSGLHYDKDVLRLIQESLEKDIPIENLVFAVTPHNLSHESEDKLREIESCASDLGVKTKKQYLVQGYPKNLNIIHDDSIWERNDPLYEPGRGLITISPGGGSGKFGVLLSEMRRALSYGNVPNYIKFETFPAFHLPYNHPLNLAFESATADLGNKVVPLSNGQSGYDKDEYNFELLKTVFQKYGKKDVLKKMNFSTDMGVNMINKGIIDEAKIVQACYEEVKKRVSRYKNEFNEGNEKESTLDLAISIKEKFLKEYSNSIISQ